MNYERTIMFGGVAGAVSSVFFLIIHHLLITPIWFVLPFAIVLGVLTGISLMRSYYSVFEQYVLKYQVKLMALFMIPILILELLTFFLLEPQFTIEEAARPENTGPMLSLSFAIVIPYAIIAGFVMGKVMGGTRHHYQTAIASCFAIFVGIGHNLPLFNLVSGIDPVVLLRLKIRLLILFVVLISTYMFIFHLLYRLSDTRDFVFVETEITEN